MACDYHPRGVPYHQSHLGEVYRDAPYARVHDLCGRPQCGCAPGAWVERDPTDHHWVLHIPVHAVRGVAQPPVEVALVDSPGNTENHLGPRWVQWVDGVWLAIVIALPAWLLARGAWALARVLRDPRFGP